MKRILDYIFHGIDMICRTILGALTLTVLTTVFGRYILNNTPRWGEELALTLIVWLSLLAVPLGIRNGWHIRLDLFHRALPRGGQKGLDVVNWVISFVLGGMFVWYGMSMAIRNLSNLMPGLGISTFWQFLSVPIAGVLILVALIEIAVNSRAKIPSDGAPSR